MASRKAAGVENQAFEPDDVINGGSDGSDNDTSDTNINWDRFEKKKTKIISSSSQNLKFKTTRNIICKILVTFFFLWMMLSLIVVSKVTVISIISRLGRPHTAFNGVVDAVDVSWVWSAFVCIVSPYTLTLVTGFWKIIFKNREKLQKNYCKRLIILLLVEFLHSVGILLLVFIVLPSFQPVPGFLLISTVGIVPSLLCTYAEWDKTCKHALWNVVNVIIAAAFIAVVVVLSYVAFDTEGIIVTVSFPVSIVFISMKWWNNFVGNKTNTDFTGHNAVNNVIVSVVKIATTFFGILVIYGYGADDTCIRTLFYLNTKSQSCSVFASYNLTTSDLSTQPCIYNFPFVLAAVVISSSFLCYCLSVAACKVKIHVPCFSLPIVSSTPVTFGVLLIIYNFHTSSFAACAINDVLLGNGLEGVTKLKAPIWICSVFSWILLCLVSRHIWMSDEEVMARREKLFCQPMYCNMLLVESLAMSRRRSTDSVERLRDVLSAGDVECTEIRSVIPTVIACVTMWHETELEMGQILKSIYRLDTDRYVRSLVDENNYELEVNIFMDDAFETPAGGTSRQLNSWCRQLITVVRDTHQCLREKNPDIGGPGKPMCCETPFGGKIVWRLPGGTVLTAFLKDKTLIRHKKRWSQVMYMYYLLGFRMSNITAQEMKKSQSTFILALDGDVDFQEDALRKLLDRMLTDQEVGAACGRIHPVGTDIGPILWYQKFEYAVSHWLQKATEHVTGCVLCAPGCFSLYRASALMDKDVIRKYATPSTESKHFVQYDQGEDRWLCTLLLQRGHRIEYCAASDSYTFAPEAFGEFFNQRKRWSPSTISNTMDLLTDWKHLTKMNNNISTLFLVYQTVLMLCFLLTPGTIFLLILGAINLAFPAIPLYGALIVNLILVGIFIVACLKTGTKTQIKFAGVLCVVYMMLMMVVLVGLLLQASKHGICSVTSLFLITVIGIFFVSAVLHPQEFSCVFAGIIYFFFTPTMSMLLIIYSLCNLNNVSWGTREFRTAGATGTTEKGEEATEKPRWQSLTDLLCRCFPFESENRIMTKLDKLEGMVQQTDVKGANQMERSGQSLAGHWTEDHCFRNKGNLSKEEKKFWNEILKKYLKPDCEPVKHQEQIKEDLKKHRNKICLLFLVANSLLIVLVGTLQMNPGLSIKLPCSFGNFVGEDFEPISVTFMVIFGILLVIQFFGMLWHRLSTFLHILATTEIPNPCERRDNLRPRKTTALEDEPDAGVTEVKGDVDGETKVRIMKYLLLHNLRKNTKIRNHHFKDSSDNDEEDDEHEPRYDQIRAKLVKHIKSRGEQRDIRSSQVLSFATVAKKIKATEQTVVKVLEKVGKKHRNGEINTKQVSTRETAPRMTLQDRGISSREGMTDVWHISSGTPISSSDIQHKRTKTNRVSPKSRDARDTNDANVSHKTVACIHKPGENETRDVLVNQTAGHNLDHTLQKGGVYGRSVWEIKTVDATPNQPGDRLHAETRGKKGLVQTSSSSTSEHGSGVVNIDNLKNETKL